MLVVFTPFAVNHLVRGRLLLGLACLAIVILFAVEVWRLKHRRPYAPLRIFLTVVPVILFALWLSLETQGVIGVLWTLLAIFSYYFILPEIKAWVANVITLLLIVPLTWIHVDPVVAIRATATMIILSGLCASAIGAVRAREAELHRQTVTDSLTSVFNRSLLASVLDSAISHHSRRGDPMTIIALDVDHFKQVNDTYGHPAGDEVLRTLGEYFLDRCRMTDTVFRTGGEEFVILLWGTTQQQAVVIAEEMREAVTSLEMPAAVTVSLGVASLRENEDWDSWLKRADESLYEAKARGRNRVEVAGPIPFASRA